MKRIGGAGEAAGSGISGDCPAVRSILPAGRCAAERYHFFNWPDYEESPPSPRSFTLLGEPAGAAPALPARRTGCPEQPHPGCAAGRARSTPAWVFAPTATCCWSQANCSMTPGVAAQADAGLPLAGSGAARGQR